MINSERFHDSLNIRPGYNYSRPGLKIARFSGLVILLILVSFSTILAQGEQSLTVPAEFERELTMPGSLDHFIRPERVLVDRTHNEIYVTDPGQNRIVIFSDRGTYLFEFSTSDQCGAPFDVAVASDGYIYVLGSTIHGKRIFIYDFDGKFISRFIPVGENGELSLSIGSLALDSNDRLYVLDQSDHRIKRFDSEGKISLEIPLADKLSDQLRREMVCGSLSIYDDIIYQPIASLGSVYRFTTDGKVLNSFGFKGSGTGELSFPVSVAVSGEGVIMVLDKHRYNVVCFTQDARFLGEFGGKGMRAGWFYHPGWIAIGSGDEVFVSQIYNNMVQICNLPKFIRDRNLQFGGQEISMDY